MKTATATLTSKGQITIPKEVRTSLQANAGDALEFRVRDDGVVEVRRQPIVADRLFGRLAAYGRPGDDGGRDDALQHADERDARTRA